MLLIGGAARSSAVQAVTSGIFGVPVSVPFSGEYVAFGAARQAAWVLARSHGHGAQEETREWSVAAQEVPESGGGWTGEVRDAYTRLRRQMHGI